MLRSLLTLGSFLALCSIPQQVGAQDLIVDGTTITLGGVHRFDRVRVINGGAIRVPAFDGTDRVNTGNLVLIAGSILVDATSRIDARGAGYQTPRCADGQGPTSTAGGRGGCALRDSGGGGAHFGRGGRGTKDCNLFGSATSCQFPQEFDEDCGNSLDAAGTACTTTTDCRGPSASWDGLPTNAGAPYRHSIYDIEFGASGGDKGCRDGDGFSSQPAVGGAGGGRVVLVALDAGATGTVQIDGTVTANGRRGCGTGNDSGGGGAGGSILIVGDLVQVGPTAVVSAAGGLGGDTFAGAAGQPDSTDCPAGAQTGGTCDDCGGGGGGGIINVLSRASTLDYEAAFDVSGADGGVCPICRGEAGGGAGELLLDGAYVGELCDGYDNDFDGAVDEGFGTSACGLGACGRSIDVCALGAPVTCSPVVDPADPSCTAASSGARPRIAVVLDTSSSMLLDLDGFPTFGDGSVERPGLDTDGNGMPDDSRLFLARNALANVISAYPEIDFALARYHQDQGLSRSCQTAKWFECQGLIGTYDDPTDNTGDIACTVAIGSGPTEVITVREESTAGDECINYAGTCGPPRRGADILSGFGTATRDLVRWLDGRETAFFADATPGDVCRHASGGDCEVRASGQTPLGGALEAVEDYVVPIRTTDGAAACRTYSIILVTDGAESCDGDPVAQAQRLHDLFGIETYVIAVSVLPEEEASLNRIAAAGSGDARPTATFVRNPADLVPALTSIIEGSIRTERCNGFDDDCDGSIDEGFAVGLACDDGGIGACLGTGATRCSTDALSVTCEITTPGLPPGMETCNGLDDDCDEGIDEGLTCTGACTPTGPEVCNGVDDDCNLLVDEVDPAVGTPCGESMGTCLPGALRCVGGMLTCIGGTGPRAEVCNGLDDDCDGEADDMAPCPAESLCIEGACRRPCDPTMEFPCPVGFRCGMPAGVTGTYCVPTACADCAPSERCIDDVCVDPCEGVACGPGETCAGGVCQSCLTLGCPSGQVCRDRACQPDPCAGVSCGAAEACVDGRCQRACGPTDCPAGQRCTADGGCEADPCAETRCDAGRVCVDGSCRADPCDGSCRAPQVCTDALGCVDDPCAVVRCPSGRRCEVAGTGVALCLSGSAGPDAGMGTPPDYVSVGGATCSVGGGGRSPVPWVALLAVGVVLFRPRRSA
jgi:hypothetical protein